MSQIQNNNKNNQPNKNPYGNTTPWEPSCPKYGRGEGTNTLKQFPNTFEPTCTVGAAQEGDHNASGQEMLS